MNNMSLFDGDGDDEGDKKDDRLATLVARVFFLMSDRHWRSLGDIGEKAGGSEASVSARLRDLRKPRFGGHTVERRLVGGGLYAYRLQPSDLGLLDGRAERSPKADARRRVTEYLDKREGQLQADLIDWAWSGETLLMSDLRVLL